MQLWRATQKISADVPPTSFTFRPENSVADGPRIRHPWKLDYLLVKATGGNYRATFNVQIGIPTVYSRFITFDPTAAGFLLSPWQEQVDLAGRILRFPERIEATLSNVLGPNPFPAIITYEVELFGSLLHE